MSLLVLSPDTVWNPGLLKFPTAPRKILQRGTLIPRKAANWPLVFRAIIESEIMRFAVTLSPFLAVGLMWPQLALPLGSAPILMIVAIGFVELRWLRVPKHKRQFVTSEADAARALDTLNFKGRRILTEIAARRQIEHGTIYLVVEQSDMARIPPLTIVSVQLDEGKSRLLALSEDERELVRNALFDDEFDEMQLHRANQRENVFMRSVSFETRGVSAHARLAAFLQTSPENAVRPA